MARDPRTAWIWAACIGLSACATGLQAPAVPSPSEIPALEASLASAPSDSIRLRLALAYRSAGRSADAVEVLEPATGGPVAPELAVTLAGAYEDLERYPEARDVYAQLLAGSDDERLRAEVEVHLRALDRLELRAAARDALTREAELSATAPSPNVVGVFPFLFGTVDPSLAPLSRALAELLTVDLSQTERLRVVERAQIQFLLDELALGESGRVDPATAARSGRLLGAGRIVQGRIDGFGTDLLLQAIPVTVGAAPTQEPGQSLAHEGPLTQVFDLEKSLALDLYASMGVELTAAERERVTLRRTENVEALLAFGFGLEAADEGRLQEAAAAFDRARQIDPGFDLADQWAGRMEAEIRLEQDDDPHRLYRVAAPPPAPPPPAADWTEVRGQYLDVELLIPAPGSRDAVTEAMGVEGAGRRGLVEIIIRPPAGGG